MQKLERWQDFAGVLDSASDEVLLDLVKRAMNLYAVMQWRVTETGKRVINTQAEGGFEFYIPGYEFIAADMLQWFNGIKAIRRELAHRGVDTSQQWAEAKAL